MTPSYSIKHFYLLLIASGLSLVGTSITWSGIPFYLFKTNSSSAQIGFTFIASQISEFILSVFLNKYIFRYDKKRIYFFSLLISGLLLFLMALSDSSHNLAFFTLCLLLLLSSSAGNICKNIWIFEIIKSLNIQDAKKPLGIFNLIEIFAKLIGFALGPIIFFYFGSKAFIIDGASYFIESMMILAIPAIKIKTSHQPNLANVFCFIKKHYYCFIISVITQIFFLPRNLLIFHILLVKLKVGHELMSYFSASIFISAILFNLIFIRIGKYFEPNKAIYAFCCLVLCFIVTCSLFTKDYPNFVALIVVYNLFSIPSTIIFNSYLIKALNQDELNIFKIIDFSIGSFVVCLILIAINLVDIASIPSLILISLFALLFTIIRIYYFGLIVDSSELHPLSVQKKFT